MARRGLFDEAEKRVIGHLHDDLSPQQKVEVLSTQAEIAFVTGRIEDVIALNIEINEVAKSFMPPMVRLMRIENQRSDLYSLLGRTEEAIALADKILVQLQPPMDAYLNFTYTTIYGAADNREAFRVWANKTQQVKDQLPPVFGPFIEFQSARLAVWDEDFDAAIAHLDSAREFLSQSMLQIFHNNLSISSLHVILAELYLQASAFDNSRDTLEEILKVFPANAYAKLTYGKLHLAEGNEEAGRKALNEALEIWSEADADYLFLKEAEALMSGL